MPLLDFLIVVSPPPPSTLPPRHQFPISSYVVTPSSFPPLPSIKSTYPGLLPLIAPTASCANPYANPIASPVFAVRAAVAIGKRSVWCLVSTSSGPMINKSASSAQCSQPPNLPTNTTLPRQISGTRACIASHFPSQALARRSFPPAHPRFLPYPPHSSNALAHLISSHFPSRVSSLRIPLSGTPASHRSPLRSAHVAIYRPAHPPTHLPNRTRRSAIDPSLPNETRGASLLP